MKGKFVLWAICLIGLALLTLVAAVVSLSTGVYKIGFYGLLQAISDKSGMEYEVLMNLRGPRVIMAFAVGGALGMTGAILQGIYRNPLVEPYTLGVSGGAALGVSIIIVFGLHQTLGVSMLPLGGFSGSLAAVFLVYKLSIKRGVFSVNRMLLIGVMISFIASSLMLFMMSVATTEDMHSIIFWVMGSLEEPDNRLISIVLFASVIGLLVSYLFARPLNALRLGEDKARHLGINSGLVIRVLFVIASLLTGVCVSVAGIIGFVGLVMPHLVRMVTGPDFRVLLGASFLGGGAFLILCDLAARTVIAPNELPIGVITGLAGGLVFLIILGRKGPSLN